MERHLSLGRRLLELQDSRYRFWLLTDEELSGGRRFARECERFDRRASREHLPTLEMIREESMTLPI